MINLFKKYTVTFLDSNWKVVKKDVKTKFVPRARELVYLPEHLKYFSVINVVYNFDGNQEIFIIIEEHN